MTPSSFFVRSACALVLLFSGLTARAQNVVNIATPANGGTGAQIAAIASSYAQSGTQVTINIPAGTYYLNQSIVMSNNMTISGAGSSTILQLPASPNGIAAFTSYGGVNMTIENLVMDGGVFALLRRQ